VIVDLLFVHLVWRTELAAEARQLLLRRGRGRHFSQARFAALRGVAVNDSALGRFIYCGNERAKFFPSRFARNAHASLERTQPCSHTPVVKRARHRLPGTLGCGLGISHSLRETFLPGLEARGGRQSCQDVPEPVKPGSSFDRNGSISTQWHKEKELAAAS